jgi:hypothetical protein
MSTPNPEPDKAAAEPQTLRGGRYVVLGTLGTGSQGETLDALDKLEGRPVAIKRFTVSRASTWKEVELAEREANVLSALNHPSLPRYFEHFEQDGALYLVMEKIEGESLAQRLRRGARFSRYEVIAFLEQVSVCLDYLHGLAPPVVHRDIKPGNVILRPDGSFCLVDFGSVRDRVKPEGGSTVVGTFGFMAPEQFQGRAAPGSDVYAVGATALSLLTGRAPEDLPHRGLGIDVASALVQHTDASLARALTRMVEPDPDRRARSVAAALRESGVATAGAASRGAEWPPGQTGHTGRGQTRAEQRRDEQWFRREEQKQQRAKQKGSRNEKRRRRDAQRGHASRPIPPGVLLGQFLLLALRIASLATFALFGLFLPILFSVLSAFNPRLRRQIPQLHAIAQRGYAGLHLASEHIRYQFLGGQAPPAHNTSSYRPWEASDAPPQRTRVVDAEGYDASAQDTSGANAEAEPPQPDHDPESRTTSSGQEKQQRP